jgi:hypothetical protein
MIGPSPSDGTRRPVLLLVACAVVSAVAAGLRAFAVAEPLGIDQGLWASGARAIARGDTLYLDFWDHKPPGIFLTYLAAFSILGWEPASIAWLDLTATLLTAAALFSVGRLLAGVSVGALATALYMALTMPAAMYGYGGFLERSINETFITLGAATGSWFATRALLGIRPVSSLAGLGLFCGAILVFKPNAGVYLVALTGWLAAARRWSRVVSHESTRFRWTDASIIGAAALVVPLLIALWLARHGLLYEGWVATIDYNLGYVALVPEGSSHAIAYLKALWFRLKTEPLWAAGAFGGVFALGVARQTRRLEPLPLLTMIWGGATAVAIYTNGAALFNSYFVPALAPLALLAAWFLVTTFRGPTRLYRVVGVAGIALVVGSVVQRDYIERVVASAALDLSMLRGRVDRAAYLDGFGGYANGRGYSARANDELAWYLRVNSKADDRVFVFGISGAETYFAADRLPGHRFVRVNYFILSSYQDPRYRVEAVVEDLRRDRPTFLIFERLHTRTDLGRMSDSLPERSDIAQLLQAYRLETRIEDYTIYRLAD